MELCPVPIAGGWTVIEQNHRTAEQAEDAASDDKWLKDIVSDQPVCEVAGRVLDVRLKVVERWLPLAADKSEEGIEYVHQLRVSVRRAAAALRAFSGLIKRADFVDLRQRLRQVRSAADEVRNLDVMCERFFGCGEGVSAKIVEKIKARRQEMTEPLVAACHEYASEGCQKRNEELVQEVASHHHGEGNRRFGQQASRYLAPLVKRFFRSTQADLTTDAALHALRLRTKKLRYTMEIVAGVFDSSFRKDLYCRVTFLQDFLGTVNDHATAKTLFGDWLSKSEDPEQKAFLEGLVLAERRATDDLKAAILAVWTPKVASTLRRKFQAYC